MISLVALIADCKLVGYRFVYANDKGYTTHIYDVDADTLKKYSRLNLKKVNKSEEMKFRPEKGQWLSDRELRLNMIGEDISERLPKLQRVIAEYKAANGLGRIAVAQ